MKALNAVIGVTVMALMLSIVVCTQGVEAQTLLEELKGEELAAVEGSSSSTDSTPQTPTSVGPATDVLRQQALASAMVNTVAAAPVDPAAMAVLAPAPVAPMLPTNIPVAAAPTPVAQNVVYRLSAAPIISSTNSLPAGTALTVTENYDYVYDWSATGGATGKGGWEQKLGLMDVVVDADLAHDANGNVTQKYRAEYADKALTKLGMMTITDIGRDSAGRVIKETVSMYSDAARTNLLVVRITDTQRDATGAVVSKSILAYYVDNAKPIIVDSQVLKDIVTDASDRMLSVTVYSYADEARTQLIEVQKIKNTYTGSSNDPTGQTMITYDSSGSFRESQIISFKQITNTYEGTSQKIVSSYDSSGKLLFKDTYKGDELISHEAPSAEMEVPTAPTIRAGAEAISNSDLDGTLSVQSTITDQAEQVKDAGASVAPQLATEKDALKDAAQK